MPMRIFWMALWNFAYVLHPACRAEYAAMRCRSWLLATLKLGEMDLQKNRTLFKIFHVSRVIRWMEKDLQFRTSKIKIFLICSLFLSINKKITLYKLL